MACIFSFAMNLFRESPNSRSFTVEAFPRFFTEDCRNWIYKFFDFWKRKKKTDNYEMKSEKKSFHMVRMLSKMEESEVLDIAEILCSEVQVNSFCEKMYEKITNLVDSDHCLIYIKKDHCHCKHLVAKGKQIFSLTQKQDIAEHSSLYETGITQHVAKTGEMLNIPNIDKDSRFKDAFDSINTELKSILCLPIKDNEGSIIGVIQMGRIGEKHPFSKSEEEILSSYLKIFAIGLKNTNSFEQLLYHLNRNQALLELTSTIFDERKNLDEIIYSILKHALESAHCERAQVLLLSQACDEFSYEYFLDMADISGQDDSLPRRRKYNKNQTPNVGIATYVAGTGETVNIEDVTKDERFDSTENLPEEFQYKTMLCLPIKRPEGEVIGVMLFVNKEGDLKFSRTDEVFLEAFSLLCGMAIYNQQMIQKIQIAKAKLEVTIEMLSYHVLAPMEEALKLKEENVPSADTLGIYSFKFNDALLSDNETLLAVIRMFLELELLQKYQIEYLVLCRWLITVKKNYRDVLYHNWRHALNVTQLMFSMLMASGWHKYFGEHVTFGMLIACLCHDLDHRGTNNDFQVEASTPLSKLHAWSTMEHHHLDLCLMILNSQGTEILSHVSPDDYKEIIQATEHVILSTDLANFLSRSKTFQELIQDNKWEWTNDNNQKLLQSMLTTASDIGGSARPWNVSIRSVARVIGEYFQQGDIERVELHLTPTEIMDRKKGSHIPQLQIGFIDVFCVPLYKTLAELSTELLPLYEELIANRRMWEEEMQRNNTDDSEFFQLLREYNIYIPEDDESSQRSGPSSKKKAENDSGFLI